MRRFEISSLGLEEMTSQETANVNGGEGGFWFVVAVADFILSICKGYKDAFDEYQGEKSNK